MKPEDVRLKLEEGRLHLEFVTTLYKDQIKRGKYFLHEHPATALSWKEDSIEKLIKGNSSITVVNADQCAYGLLTPSISDPNKMEPALKPTKFMTNSEIMANQLMRRCNKLHRHQPLVGGRCKAAAMYPVGLIKSILKG